MTVIESAGVAVLGCGLNCAVRRFEKAADIDDKRISFARRRSCTVRRI